MREEIYFAHANGFPAGVYQKLFDVLAEHHNVGALDMVGHDERYPVTDCWPHLVTQTIDYIARQYSRPVVGVGHSLGGVLMLNAAVLRPDLFKSIILLDSPVVCGWRGMMVWFAKRLGWIDRITPAGRTKNRRSRWASAQKVREHFANRAPYSYFDQECLRDYAERGTVVVAGQERQLKFSPAVEYQIFCTLPHNLSALKGRLKVPATYIAALDAPVISPSELLYLHKRLGMQVEHHSGSHLFPLERPVETANHIMRLIGRLAQ